MDRRKDRHTYMHVGRSGKSCFDLMLLLARKICHGTILLVLDDLIYMYTETEK